jgi:hypothetical protein
VVGEQRIGDPSGRDPKTQRVLRAESVDVDTAHFGGVEVLESDRARPNVDGIIGLNLFKGLLVTFDYPKSRFKLSGGTLPAAGALAYTTEHGVPSFEIDVAGRKAKVDIDSGSPGEVTLPLAEAKSLALEGEPAVVGRGMTADGPFDVYAATLKGTVTVGEIALENPRVDFIGVFPVGNVGSRFLSKLVVTFDPANRKVRFAAPPSA